MSRSFTVDGKLRALLEDTPDAMGTFFGVLEVVSGVDRTEFYRLLKQAFKAMGADGIEEVALYPHPEGSATDFISIKQGYQTMHPGGPFSFYTGAFNAD